ncbi:hypothetical protein [Magnetospirillum sp. UT-4]|uniref:hypothetical protein n=1 Tax=Magnetospirillum sp. UT-4 TaxID=2681467 RepID=UPI00138479B1|nr:hypothetical protein [Magnetospirillum sp. UT-4]CAA7623772.1 hypothetical protein MTBUT4_520016 [Magnetospirillum sp. UT-4]
MAHPEDHRAPGQKEFKPGDTAWEGTPGTGEALCPTCGGSGKADGAPCPDCEGTGVVVAGIGGA